MCFACRVGQHKKLSRQHIICVCNSLDLYTTSIMKSLLTSSIVLLAVVVLTQGLSFTLGPGKEECFYENVNQGTTVSIVFQVNTGGRNDIDLNVRI